MISKMDNQGNPKVTNRINKLCSTTRGLSDKDTIALSYIINKASRISTVALMLADVLDSNVELKSEIQRSAIGLVKDATGSVHSSMNREALARGLMNIVTLLDVAQRSGVLSKMNTETLSDEIVSFSEFLTAIEWHTGRRYAEDMYFGGEVPRDVFSPEPIVTRSETYYRRERDMREPGIFVRHPERVSYDAGQQKDIEQKERFQYKDKLQEIQKDRRAVILGLVQKKDRITVKDVSNVIKDCGEKTIQRELLALVKNGVLKKEGERRWSTYSMA